MTPPPPPDSPAAAPWAEFGRTVLDVAATPVLGNTLGHLFAAAALLVLAVVLRSRAVPVLFRRLGRQADRTGGAFDDTALRALESPVRAFILVLGGFLAASVLRLPGEAATLILRLFQAATATIVLWAALRSVDAACKALVHFSDRRGLELAHLVPLIKKGARIFVLVIGVILVAQNLGFSVASLLAGLGIGGLAVALAAQETLGNLFGSITLSADLPFKTGDWVRVGTSEGIVEEVGLRSTKIRSFGDTLLQIPNRLVAAEPIENFSRRRRRLVTQTLGVDYATGPAQMEALLAALRGVLQADPGVDPGSAAVHFADFGDNALAISVLFYTREVELMGHRATRERINLAFQRAFAAAGVAFVRPK